MKAQTQPSIPGVLGAVWGLSGVSLLLILAIVRLTPIAWEAVGLFTGWHHWLMLLVWLAVMGHSEGYKGFQKAFAPRVAARAKYLLDHPTPIRCALAPFFCMAYFHATRKRKIVSYSLTLGIICLVVLVRFLTQPWRGIVDAGVVFGLTWGLGALWLFSFKAFCSDRFAHDPEVPAGEGMVATAGHC